jgi:hypothetical protein
MGSENLPLFGRSIPPLVYQSRQLSFDDWVTLLTLCFAPLIAHVLAGSPQPSILASRYPRWHDLVSNYHPTSIIWRYIAIADRRIRARQWSAVDLAATNAAFWTPTGWDGSESIITASMPFCTRLPKSSRAELLSWETFKTIIVTFQGVQAVYSVSKGASGKGESSLDIPLDKAFFGLSILGFIRLCAAPWLTEEYSYTFYDKKWMELTAQLADPLAEVELSDESRPFATDYPQRHRYHATSHWKSRLFRAIACFMLMGFWVTAMLATVLNNDLFGSLTVFLGSLILSIGLAASVAIWVYFLCRGHTTSTIIPCVSSLWYKTYTLITVICMLVILVISAIETRKLPCGLYTTIAQGTTTRSPCQSSDLGLVDVGSGSSIFGLAANLTASTLKMTVFNFTGSCFGRVDLTTEIFVYANG